MVQASKRIPAAPPGLDLDRFFAGVYWHQRWQIFDGIHTPGKNPIAPQGDKLLYAYLRNQANHP